MNDTIRPPGALGSDVPWPTSRERLRVPDTSMLPGGDSKSPPAVKLLNDALQGAHTTLDQLADRAEPAAQELGSRVSAAGAALQEKTEQLRETRDEWTESLRRSVRRNPLACIAAAAVFGVMIARITR